MSEQYRADARCNTGLRMPLSTRQTPAVFRLTVNATRFKRTALQLVLPQFFQRGAGGININSYVSVSGKNFNLADLFATDAIGTGKRAEYVAGAQFLFLAAINL